MVGEFGEVFLTDWGLAVRLGVGLVGPVGRNAGAGSLPCRDRRLHGARADRVKCRPDRYLDRRLPARWHALHAPDWENRPTRPGRPRSPSGWPRRATSHPSGRRRRAGTCLRSSRLSPTGAWPRIQTHGRHRRAPSSRSCRAIFRVQGNGGSPRRWSPRPSAAWPRQTTSYRDFGDLLSLLGRSRTLWPENPALDAVTDRALVAWTRAALGSGDLVLARVQAERVHDPAARAALVADVDDRGAPGRARATPAPLGVRGSRSAPRHPRGRRVHPRSLHGGRARPRRAGSPGRGRGARAGRGPPQLPARGPARGAGSDWPALAARTGRGQGVRAAPQAASRPDARRRARPAGAGPRHAGRRAGRPRQRDGRRHRVAGGAGDPRRARRPRPRGPDTAARAGLEPPVGGQDRGVGGEPRRGARPGASRRGGAGPAGDPSRR